MPGSSAQVHLMFVELVHKIYFNNRQHIFCSIKLLTAINNLVAKVVHLLELTVSITPGLSLLIHP